MKIGRLCAAVVVAVLALPAYAQELSPWYAGLKAGTMDVDASGFKEAGNAALFLGYTLYADANGRLAFEGEVSRTISDGDAPGGGWDINTLAAYGAYRTAGNVFLKAKAGFLSEDVNVSGTGGSVAGSDSGVSFGAGVGVRMGKKAAFEIEYTVVEDDISFVSLAYFTHF